MKYSIILTNYNYPENRGITQLANKLSRKGLHPIIISLPPHSSDKQITNDITLKPFYSSENRLYRIIFAQSFWWNPILLFHIAVNVIKYRPVCIFVREPNFLLAPLIIGRIWSINVYVDIRENPEFAFLSNKGVSFTRRLLAGPRLVKLFFLKRALKMTSHIFGVSSELCQFIGHQYGIDAKNLSVLPNYPSRPFLVNAFASESLAFAESQYSLRLIHAGNVTEDRGLQDILPAIARLKEQGYRCLLTIVGNGGYITRLQQQSSELMIIDMIDFIPAIEPLHLPDLLAKNDIGICSNRVNENSVLTIPGKLFEYMAAGLAILSSPRPTVMSIIADANCGIAYDCYETSNIADKLSELAADRDRTKAFGTNARAYLKAKIEGNRYDLPDWVCNSAPASP